MKLQSWFAIDALFYLLVLRSRGLISPLILFKYHFTIWTCISNSVEDKLSLRHIVEIFRFHLQGEMYGEVHRAGIPTSEHLLSRSGLALLASSAAHTEVACLWFFKWPSPTFLKKWQRLLIYILSKPPLYLLVLAFCCWSVLYNNVTPARPNKLHRTHSTKIIASQWSHRVRHPRKE